MKKILIIISIFSLSLSLGLSPGTHFAQAAVTGAPPKLDYSGFVKCDGVVNPAEKDRQTVCNFAALMDTLNKMISWIFYMTIPVCVALFAYAGLMYMTGIKGKIDDAKKILKSVAVGFIIMLTAWLIVRTVVGWFVDPSFNATIFLDATNKN